MRIRLFLLAFLASCVLQACTSTCPTPEGPWHPERTDYPRLIYTADQLPEIAGRLDRYPYDVLYARVLSRASRTPNLDPDGDYDAPREYSNANIAKSCAFAYAVSGDPAYLDKAVLILENLATVLEPFSVDLFQYDIHIAEALQGYCQAFDILMGTGDLPEEDRVSIEGRLGSLTEGFFCVWASEWCAYYEEQSNNHHTKMATAIGIAAITINQHSMAQVWIDYAMHHVTQDLELLTTPDGGYAEGPDYWVYSAVNVLPFAWAYHTFTGGLGEVFEDRPCGAGGLVQDGPQSYVEDYFTAPAIQALGEWMIKIRQPDGTHPPFDDSNQGGYFNGMMAGVHGDGVFAWDWLNAPGAPLVTESCADLTVDMIVGFDDTLPALEPEWNPTQFMPEAGQAVMRSGWGTDDTYLLFLAENGKAREMGYAHEHPDGLSFILYAEGETLAMDSGYIKWDDHDLVRHADNHNLVLVDGQGPSSPTVVGVGGKTDAFFSDYFTTGFMDYCAAWTEHNSTTHHRDLLFPGRRFVLVADTLEGWDADHTYQWLLHGNGGGSTEGAFSLTGEGGVWQIGDARLDAAVTSTESAPSLRSYEDYHGFSYGQIETHQVLEASAAGRDVRFLSLLCPSPSAGPLPSLAVYPDGEGRAVGVISEADRTAAAYFVSPDLSGLPWAAAGLSGHPEFPDLSTDADLVYLAVDSGSGDILEAFGRAVTSLEVRGAALVSTDVAVTLALEIGTGRVEGHLLSSGPATLDLQTGGEPADVTGSGVTGFTYLGGGVTQILFSASSGFEVTGLP